MDGLLNNRKWTVESKITYTDGEEVTELGLRFRLLLRRENEAIDCDTPSANGSGNVAGWDFLPLALFLPKKVYLEYS